MLSSEVPYSQALQSGPSATQVLLMQAVLGDTLGTVCEEWRGLEMEMRELQFAETYTKVRMKLLILMMT